MIIALGGKEGSGKGTCARQLAEKLGYEHISIGEMKRALAKEMNLQIHEFDLLGELPENKIEFDLKYEEYQKSLPLESKVILDSRLSYRCQPQAFKVYLEVDQFIGAQRIFEAQRDTDNYNNAQEVLLKTQQRYIDNKNRYIKLYNTDLSDMNNYDLVVDTTDKDAESVVAIIMEKFAKHASKILQN